VAITIEGLPEEELRTRATKTAKDSSVSVANAICSILISKIIPIEEIYVEMHAERP
jgi:hypothetical protein